MTLARTGIRRRTTPRLAASRRTLAAAQKVVAERSGGICEICQHAAAVEFQHRIRRGQGGSSRNPAIHRVSSLLHLCRSCHHDADHHTDRFVFGWSVYRDRDTTEALVLLGGSWFLLDDEGGRHAAPNGGDTDA